jgi:hypothetical protein
MSMTRELIDYESFRSGYTFVAIRRELACEASAVAARGEMMHVTRRTVLGRWRQRKLELYQQYQAYQASGR